jgi:hypothetical protein
MFEQQQGVVGPPGAPLFDERSLQRQRFEVWNASEPSDFDRTHE